MTPTPTPGARRNPTSTLTPTKNHPCDTDSATLLLIPLYGLPEIMFAFSRFCWKWWKVNNGSDNPSTCFLFENQFICVFFIIKVNKIST